MWTSNGVGVTSRKIAHATHDSSHVIKTNLQIIPFSTNDIQLGREEDYAIAIP